MKQNQNQIKSAESRQYSKKAEKLTNALCAFAVVIIVAVFTVVFLRGCEAEADSQLERAKQHQAQFSGVK